jgi:hypothetical protein
MIFLERESASRRGMVRLSQIHEGALAPFLGEVDHAAKEVNYFSICTNDSNLYTLDIDRTCEIVAGPWCTACSVVLRSIATVVEAASGQRPK